MLLHNKVEVREEKAGGRGCRFPAAQRWTAARHGLASVSMLLPSSSVSQLPRLRILEGGDRVSSVFLLGGVRYVILISKSPQGNLLDCSLIK